MQELLSRQEMRLKQYQPKNVQLRPQTASVEEIGKMVKQLTDQGCKVQVSFTIEPPPPPPPQLHFYELEEETVTTKTTLKGPFLRFNRYE